MSLLLLLLVCDITMVIPITVVIVAEGTHAEKGRGRQWLLNGTVPPLWLADHPVCSIGCRFSRLSLLAADPILQCDASKQWQSAYGS